MYMTAFGFRQTESKRLAKEAIYYIYIYIIIYAFVGRKRVNQLEMQDLLTLLVVQQFGYSARWNQRPTSPSSFMAVIIIIDYEYDVLPQSQCYAALSVSLTRLVSLSVSVSLSHHILVVFSVRFALVAAQSLPLIQIAGKYIEYTSPK